jgi:hypothetical protein
MNSPIYAPFLIGIICIILAIPLLLGKIKMNHTYGFRLKKAFESEDNWFRINKYGAKHLLFWGVLLVMVGLLPKVIPIHDRYAPLIGLLCAIAAVVGFCLPTYLYAKKL